ncbi:MAG: AraC family transcriptional regulator [Nitratireductor sp.]
MVVSAQSARPEEWLNYLGGTPVAEFRGPANSPVLMGHFSYAKRPDQFRAPPIGSHYLSVTLSGCPVVERILDGRRVEGRFRPGTCLLMPANSSNAWRWSGPTEELQIFLDAESLRTAGRAEGLGEITLKDSFAFCDDTIWHFVKMLQSSAQHSNAMDRVWLKSLGQLLIAHLLRCYTECDQTGSRRGGLTRWQLSRVSSLVDGNLHEPLRIEDLSRAIGMSAYHFARQFKKETGQTPYQWLQAKRVAHAKTLLDGTDLPIVEIAALSGFQSQSRFGVVFKEHTGASPTDFRIGRA